MRKLPTMVPFALLPHSKQFDELVGDCTRDEISAKFLPLKKLTSRGLRAEVGSASRLLNATFRHPAFAAACRGGFRLGPFYQNKGKLFIQRGRGTADDPMRLNMGAVILLTRAAAVARDEPLPTIRLRIDEAANAGLLTRREIQNAAETNKWGLYHEYNLQRDPGGGLLEDLLQLCHRHEFYLCNTREMARKAAVDFDAGLEPVGDEESRAQRVERLTTRFMNLRPGERGVRDAAGSRFERVGLLENPWPDWPGLRKDKLNEKMSDIYRRPEYQCPPEIGGDAGNDSSPGSPSTPPPSPKSPTGGSPAERFKRGGKGLRGGS